MNLQHTFVFEGTHGQFIERLRNRGKAVLSHYLHRRDEAKPFVQNGLEYTIHSFPELAGDYNKIHRLEYYTEGSPVGMNIWEQIEKSIYPTKELGMVIEMTPRVDGRTDITATCLHPAYEQEFKSIFGIDEQAEDDLPIPLEEVKIDNPKHELLKCNRWLIDQYFNQGNTTYKKLVDEWLRIRKDDDCKEPPTNPEASIRTVIHEENKRRRA